MDRAYADGYRQLHERHWWWRAREAHLLRWLVRLRPPGGFGPILDVGCGEALWFERLRALGVPEGVEADPVLARAAGVRDGSLVHAGPFDETFQPGRRYGLVLMLDVLEHLDDDRGGLSHAAALLAPGGVLVATVPAFQALWTGHDDLNAHRRRYTSRGLARLVEGAGLEVEHRSYFFNWLVLPKLAVAALERVSRAEPHEPRLGPRLIQAALYRLCLLEQRTWGRLPLPFGASALVIARKRGEPRRPD